MRREVHLFRLPRLVTGHLGRGRQPTRIAVWDDVPVEVAALAEGEAPVAFRRSDLDPVGVRIHDGAAYEILGHGATPTEAWDGIMAEAGRQLEMDLGMPRAGASSPYARLLPWHETLKGASRQTGIVPAGEVRFREVVDDGVAGQRRLAAMLAERVALVEGRPWLRSGLPRLWVLRFGEKVHGIGTLPTPDHRHDPAIGEPWGVDHFPVDRQEEAEAYVATLVRERKAEVVGSAAFPVLADRDALSECYRRAGGRDALAMAALAETLAGALRPTLSGLPDAEIRRYLELRDLAAARDAAGIRAWLDGLDATRAAVAQAFPKPGNGPRGRMWEHEWEMDVVRARYDAIDGPRMGRAADAEALAALSM